jgi:serine protease AprX
MKSHIHRLSSLILAALVLLAVPAAVPAHTVSQNAWQAKVDPWVLEQAGQGSSGEAEFLVYLDQQADLSGVPALRTKAEKGRYVYQQLTSLAERTQGPLIQALTARGLDYRSYWIANMLWVRGDAAAVQALAQRGDVAHLYANPWVKMEAPPANVSPLAPEAAQGIEWNLLHLNADKVWAAGYTGQGIVIGGQDTGYDWEHPALKGHYRGWDGQAADHDYNWHDAIQEGNIEVNPSNPCSGSTEPCDDYGHGTHTMGIMVGDDGEANQIGMAPGARWIGCRNMQNGVGSPATYADCYQWFLAPTDLNSQNPRPDLAPDVINNSWGCPSTEGCTDPNVLRTVVENVRSAGILTVHSAGNQANPYDNDDDCGTIGWPATIYEASFSVGATNSLDNIASFSSRGPVTVDGSGRLKPDVSAPGVGITSSWPNGSYAISSGTSMAAPHVAGLAALVLSAEPALRGQVDALENLIESTALPREDQICGGVKGSAVPNNVYGWGRVDAWSAYQGVQHILSIQKRAASIIAPGNLLTYTLTAEHTHIIQATHNVVISDHLPLHTTFITATTPYSLEGDTIAWSLPSLDPGASQSVTLTVRTPPTVTLTLRNDDYSIRSDEVNEPVSGLPVTTTLLYQQIFPLINKGD